MQYSLRNMKQYLSVHNLTYASKNILTDILHDYGLQNEF